MNKRHSANAAGVSFQAIPVSSMSMKNHPENNSFKSLALSLLAACAVLAATPAHAAVMAIDSITVSPTPTGGNVTPVTLDDGPGTFDLLTFTAGGTQYGSLVGPTATVVGGDFTYFITGVAEPTNDAALTGLGVSSGVANAEADSVFQFGQSIENVQFVMLELTGNDDLNLELVDSLGNGLGATLTTANNVWGSNLITNTYTNSSAGSFSTIAGVSFSTSDFTGGTTVGATGVKIFGGAANDIDMLTFAISPIPEPSSLALLGAAGLALLARRRRRH